MRKPTLFVILFALGCFGALIGLAVSRYVEAEQKVQKTSIQKINELEKRVKALKDIQAALGVDMMEVIHSNPELTLNRLNNCLDGIEQVPGFARITGREDAFTDWFVSELDIAIEAGASKRSVNSIISRVQSLARQGKYISPNEKEIDKSGPTALRDYLLGLRNSPPTKQKNKVPSGAPYPEGPGVPDSQADQHRPERRTNVAGRF